MVTRIRRNTPEYYEDAPEAAPIFDDIDDEVEGVSARKAHQNIVEGRWSVDTFSYWLMNRDIEVHNQAVVAVHQAVDEEDFMAAAMLEGRAF